MLSLPVLRRQHFTIPSPRKHFMKALITVAVCAALASTSVTAQEHGKPPAGKPPAAKPAPAKAETYAIVKVGEEMKVVSATDLAAMQKKAEADHKKAMEEFDKAKKDAETAKKPFTTKPPVAMAITVEHGDFATKEAADAELAKMKAAKDKEKAGKEKGKEAGGDAGKKGKEGK